MDEKLSFIHPGEILMEEFLKPMNISQYRLAKDISVPPRRINEIVRGLRAITPDTALRLSRYFGLICKLAMTLKLKKTIFKTGLIKKSAFTQWRHKNTLNFWCQFGEV